MSFRIGCFFILFIVLFLFSSCQQDKKFFIEKDKFLSQIEKNEEYIRNISKALAFDKEIVGIYTSLKVKVGDLEKIEKQKEAFYEYGYKLKNIFNEIIKKYERDIGLSIKYNFYLPSGVLWVIPDKPHGEDIILQDKSKEKINIIEVFNKKRIIHGIVLETNALIYSATTPVFNESGEILGAIEVWTDFLSLLDYYLYQNAKAKIIVVLKNEVARYFPSIPKDKKTDKGFVLFSNLENLDYQLIINKSFSLKNEDILQISGRKFIIIDLFDFKNNKIGQILFSPY